jgi:hypothetical protein
VSLLIALFRRFITSQALVELIEEDDLARRATFPEKAEIREIACHLAARVFQMSIEEGIRVSQIKDEKTGQLEMVTVCRFV